MAAKRPKLSANDITGAWAIIPTPSTDNASDWRAQNTVDLDELARIVEATIAAGADGILSLGTFGECATLTAAEKKAVTSTVVDVVRGRVPFFTGTTTLGTRQTIAETRAALDLGVDGTMLGPPFWCKVDVAQAVQFYRDLAEACPDVAICIYYNTAAFKFEFPHEFWGQVATIPQVIMSKYLGIPNLKEDLAQVKGRIRLLPVDNQYVPSAKIDPEAVVAFWTSNFMMGPAPVIRLRDEVANARKTGDWSGAEHVLADMAAAGETMVPKGDRALLYQYNIPLEKVRMDVAGWCKAGPMRPPYHINPEEYLEGAREVGRRWKALHERYSRELQKT